MNSGGKNSYSSAAAKTIVVSSFTFGTVLVKYYFRQLVSSINKVYSRQTISDVAKVSR